MATTAWAHVGSPDIFFEGNAGPYKLFVTIRMPDVIPGVAQVEIRSQSPGVTAIHVQPLRLTGAGSQFAPIAEALQATSGDRQFFTGHIWLMEFNTLQLRVEASGDRGNGMLAVPVMAEAQRTLGMNRPLGILLFSLMLFLAVSSVLILRAALGEAKLEPGASLETRNARRLRWTTGIAAAVVITIIALANTWWKANAAAYSLRIMKPPVVSAVLDKGNNLSLIAPQGQSSIFKVSHSRAEMDQTLPWSQVLSDLRPDHGHLMHLFLVREPGWDYFLHLHPERDTNGFFSHDLPGLPAGHYQIFADVVTGSGLAVTMIGQTDLPQISGSPLQGDDSAVTARAQTLSAGQASAPITDGHMIWERGDGAIHARTALELKFRVEDSHGSPVNNLEPYMGMAGHLVVLKSDGNVFAHVHPAGSVAMASLELAQQSLGASSEMEMSDMQGMKMQPSAFGPDVSFPYGFPKAGDYRLFVQVKRNGQVQTGVFDVAVQP